MTDKPLPWASGSTQALAGTLTAWIREPSVCGTEDEARFGRRLAALVQSLPYFRRHPAQVVVLPARGAWEPPVVAAWVRGEARAPEGPGTAAPAAPAGGAGARPFVVLAGHYDTVGVDDLLAHEVDPFDPQPLEVLAQDYIRTARVKGLSERVVYFRHALKNALIPVVSIVSLQVGYMLSGAIVVENVFGYAGMGQLAVYALNTRDYPVIQAVVLVATTCFVLVNLAVDLLYTLLDPRIRYA